MDTFVVFKKQSGEKTHSYSLINDEIVKTIPKKIIFAVKKVPSRLYSSDELASLRDDIVSTHHK